MLLRCVDADTRHMLLAYDYDFSRLRWVIIHAYGIQEELTTTLAMKGPRLRMKTFEEGDAAEGNTQPWHAK
jgi:hypothetical protein